MTPIPSVQSLQPGLPHPDVEFLQQKDRSETHGVGQFSDFYGRVSRVVYDWVMILLEIKGRPHGPGVDLGQLIRA